MLPTSAKRVPSATPALRNGSSPSSARKDTKVKKPKTSSAQTPSDMGVAVLKLSPSPPGEVLTIMCQKRSGWPRSTVRKIGQSSTQGKASRYPVRATGPSPPRKRTRVAIT